MFLLIRYLELWQILKKVQSIFKMIFKVNHSSSVNNGLAKTFLVVDMVKNNWLPVVAGRVLHYVASALFASFLIVVDFSTA